MNIAGFQAMSLIDYPGVISAMIFTQGCVFRCPYCHNPDLVSHTNQSSGIPFEEILTRLRRHRAMVEGVCVTGGEPTIHHDLPDVLRALKREGFLVKLDSNGVHPHMIKQIIDDRLVDYLAMDLKQVWEKYDEVARTGSDRVIENCKQTFDLIQSSQIRHEFRTTIYRGLHTEDDIMQIAMQLGQGERYALQPIRYGKTLDSQLAILPPVDVENIAATIRVRRPDIELLIRG